MKIILIVVCSVLLLGSIACKQQKEKLKLVYHNQNQYLIVEAYDKAGKLRVSISYNRDTVQNGAEILYYPNGKIKKWAWYNTLIGDETRRKYAYIFFYYNEKGDLDSTNGTPFIQSLITKSGYTAVEMVNPPLIKYQIGYTDFLNDTLMRKIVYEPAVSDSTSWVTLEEHKFEQGHTYKVYYYILNKSNKIIDSMSRELVPSNASSSPK